MSFHFLCPMSVNNCGSFPVTLLCLLPRCCCCHRLLLLLSFIVMNYSCNRRKAHTCGTGGTRQQGNKAAAGTFCGPATGTCALRVAASISSWPVCGTLNVSIPHTVSSLHSAAGLWIAQSCMISRQSFGNAKNNKKKTKNSSCSLLAPNSCLHILLDVWTNDFGCLSHLFD